MVTLTDKRQSINNAEEIDDFCVFSVEDFDLNKKSKLGQGGFATVFVLTYVPTQTKCALKVIKGENVNKEEVSVLRGISHENIIPFYGCVRVEQDLGCVLEFAEHGNLQDAIQRKSAIEINSRVKMHWMCDLSEGLVYLHHEHEPPIYHGDIKALNILICSKSHGQTVAKLADFGLSRVLEKTTAARGEGTPLWTAPEVIQWRAKSLKSDIWSYGVTVMEVFTERSPFFHIRQRFKRLDDLLHDVLRGKITPLTDLDDEILFKFPSVFSKILPNTFRLDHKKRWTILKIYTELMKDVRTTSVVSKAVQVTPEDFTVIPQQNVEDDDTTGAVASGGRSCEAEKVPTRPSGTTSVKIMWEFDKRPDFSLSLPFVSGTVRGSHLRSAVCEERKVAASDLRLLQTKGRRRQDDVVVVSTAAMFFSWATTSGERVQPEDVIKQETVELQDEPLLFPGPYASLIIAQRK